MIRIEEYFSGERTVAEAFGEAYARYFEYQEKMKRSRDTFAGSIFTHYNLGNTAEEADTNGKADG